MSGITRKEEQVLLAVYRLEKGAYLIPIRELIRQFTGRTYSVGTIYAPLNRLHRHGYLESETRLPQDPAGGKPIKYYRLTQKGLDALANLKRENEKMWEGFSLPVFEE
jgi:DNA-binding PadR family transcriptional regulator